VKLHFTDDEIRSIVVDHVVEKLGVERVDVLSTITTFDRVGSRFARPRRYLVNLYVEVEEGALEKKEFDLALVPCILPT